MTRIDPALLAGLASVLQTPVQTPQLRRRKSAPTKPADAGERSRSELLCSALSERIAQLQNAGAPSATSLSDADLLTMAIQETLALTFGAEISTHPRFGEVVRRIHAVLFDAASGGAGVAEIRGRLSG